MLTDKLFTHSAVNTGWEIKAVMQYEADESDNVTDINDIEVPLVVPEDVPLLSHGELRVPPTTVYDDGRFVTDV